MLYTGKGDKGETTLFACNQKISKSSAISEALGSMDECNSFLGFAKVMSEEKGYRVGESGPLFHELVHKIQQTLFIIQAELAGSPMSTEESKVRELEQIIADIEKELPPIHTFFISGGTELAATFDFARTLARRAERRVVGVKEEESRPIGEWTLAYMNRLSSILYALARLSNYKSGIKEQSPDYI
jgi:cob(I)alamin adenosyltransferase